jgi:hypothetical protein
VAGAVTAPVDPWAGVWIAEDIETILAGVRSGSWIDTSLGAVSAGLDALAFVSDPIGGLLQYGVAWILEHVKPLSDALDWLAGDPAQIAGHALTWRNVAGALRDRAEELGRAARWDTAEWTGAAADAYRRWSGRQQNAVGGLAGAAETLAAITEAAGMLVAGVRVMVRDAIAVLVSRLISYAAEEVFSVGLATPLVVEQVSSLCAAWAAKIARWLRDLIGSLARLRGLADKIDEAIEALKRLLSRLHGERHSEPVRTHGGHSSRPRNSADYERQERWANDAYEDIRANPDTDVISNNLRNVDRLDGSTGFSPEEIDRIRQQIFFEEHPVSDYDGGIVSRRYDASPDMAEAWLRMRSGHARPEDITLLEHESAEARYYNAHPGATYEDAHRAANAVANWQNRIPDPTYEDYSTPWR